MYTLLALLLCLYAHRGDRDKGGRPYSLHPVRVALAQTSPTARQVALLHDVVEDHPDRVSQSAVRRLFGVGVSVPLALLTHDPAVPYHEYIRLLGADPVAASVKLADLADNMDLRRLPSPTDSDRARLCRYKAADAWLRGCR